MAYDLRQLEKLDGPRTVLRACDALDNINDASININLPQDIIQDTTLWISAAILAACTGQVQEFKDGILRANESLKRGLRSMAVN